MKEDPLTELTVKNVRPLNSGISEYRTNSRWLRLIISLRVSLELLANAPDLILNRARHCLLP